MIIVPGYGMAVAQAQHQVRELADLVEKRGGTVKYAIHPVAGRMPGHMNVLLAEANVPYDRLYEMDEINDEFADTDVCWSSAPTMSSTRGAHRHGPPIYGMPIINADQAKMTVVFKRSMAAGFAAWKTSFLRAADMDALRRREAEPAEAHPEVNRRSAAFCSPLARLARQFVPVPSSRADQSGVNGGTTA